MSSRVSTIERVTTGVQTAPPAAPGRLARWWWPALVVAFVGCGVGVGLGEPLGRFLPTFAAGGLLVAAVGGRGRRQHSPGQRPWMFIAASAAVIVVASREAVASPYPSVQLGLAALVLVLAYPMLAKGILGLLGVARFGRDADLNIRAALTAVTSGLGLWAFLGVRPATGAANPGLLTVAITFVALDLGLISLAARLVMGPDATKSHRLLVAGLSLAGVAHMGAVLAITKTASPSPVLLRLLLVGAAAGVGLAGLHPSSGPVRDVDRATGGTDGHWHLAHVAACLFVVPAFLMVEAGRHARTSASVAIAAFLVEIVIVAYVDALLRARVVSEHQAEHDRLTGLPNGVLFADRVDRALAGARRRNNHVVVMLVDLDQFKHVNDSVGHAGGDALLAQLAQRLRDALRDADTVARLGSDEFGILLPEVAAPTDAARVAVKLLDRIGAPFGIGEATWALTASVGIATYPEDGVTCEELLSRAEAAMYEVKARGRNGFEAFAHELVAEAHEVAALEADLHSALENDELVVYYQPQIDLASGRIVGAEALVRWQHPRLGLLSPDAFIPLAEQTGQIVRLGEVVLLAACEQNHRWQTEGLMPITVAVNVSVRQFRHRIADTVASVLRLSRLNPRYLEVELTESAAADGLDVIREVLGELKSMGVRSSIDDFGTGYCSLSYLSRLPVDGLKIDKSFIGAMDEPGGSEIVRAIVSLAHSLQLTVVAEGVETDEQVKDLSDFGCDEVQGYVFARPMPAKEFHDLLLEQTRYIERTAQQQRGRLMATRLGA